MKLLRYSSPDGEERFGVYSKGMATDLSSSYTGFAEMVADIPQLKAASQQGFARVDNGRIMPPADRRSKVLCMAANYHSHIREMGTNQTSVPVLFPKFHTSLTGPYSRIPRFAVSQVMDYEGELAVVIGRSARNVRREDAWDYIFGYTLVNDMSARSLFRVPQGDGVMLDWFSCKSIDHSTPMGPWIVTPDEAGAFAGFRIETYLNGVRVQSEGVSDMVFDVPRIVEHVSSRLTLDPGDIISTGTPSGVGVARNRTLERGDVVKVQVEGVGLLENHVV